MCQEYAEAHWRSFVTYNFPSMMVTFFRQSLLSVVHPLFEEGLVQSLALLTRDSGEICFSFFHAVIKKAALAK